MKVYQPQINVTLVKTRARDFVSGSFPAAANRFKEVRIINLTQWLADGGVHISKSVREPAGTFSVSLTPRTYRDESLDMMIEPMDMIEIRLARNPSDKSPPVVMRGFVTQVAKSESIANGVPQRTLVISGHDYGKILQIIQIFYLNGSIIGDNILHTLGFFQKFATIKDAKIMTAEQFIALFVTDVINPFLRGITALADRDGGMPNVVFPKVTISGQVSPFGVGNAQDMSAYQLAASFLDVGTFNEMFIDDDGADLWLTVRPIPCWGGDGLPYNDQDVLPEEVKIGLGDVVSTQLVRDDTGVYNIYEVQNTRISVIEQQVYRAYSMKGIANGYGWPLRFKELNQEDAIFGLRRLNVNLTLNNPALESTDRDKKEQKPINTALMEDWISGRRERLFLLNKSASVFEHGVLRLKGNEKLRAGMRLIVRHSDRLSVTYYVPSVSHEYIPGQGFFTTANVERGNGFILSAGIERSPDTARRDLGGVM